MRTFVAVSIAASLMASAGVAMASPELLKKNNHHNQRSQLHIEYKSFEKH